MSPKRIDTHIRVPEDIHATLEDEANRLGLSLNALIVTILANWYGQR